MSCMAPTASCGGRHCPKGPLRSLLIPPALSQPQLFRSPRLYLAQNFPGLESRCTAPRPNSCPSQLLVRTPRPGSPPSCRYLTTCHPRGSLSMGGGAVTGSGEGAVTPWGRPARWLSGPQKCAAILPGAGAESARPLHGGQGAEDPSPAQWDSGHNGIPAC